MAGRAIRCRGHNTGLTISITATGTSAGLIVGMTWNCT